MSEAFGRGAEDFKQADWLAEELNREWRYDHTAGQWHHWTGTRWAPDKVEEALFTVASRARIALARGTWVEGGEPLGEYGVKVMLSLLKVPVIRRALEALAAIPDYATDGEDWDTNPYLMGCENGIVDLRLNALVPAEQTMLVTKTTGTKFKPVAGPEEFYKRAPKFMQFIEQVTAHQDGELDGEMVSFLLLWFGSSLFGFSPEQRFLLMTGAGRNGKGTLKNAILQAIGEYGKQADANIYMRSKYGAPRSDGARADLMDLKGKRVTFFSEPEGGRFNDELLKAHTGEDFIEARGLYQSNPLRWVPTHSITFLVNDLPSVEDVGPSMAGRVLVADFLHRYEGENANRRLSEDLKSEAAGILAILAFAGQAWHASWSEDRLGLTVPPRVEEQSRRFIERNDPVASCIEEALVVDPDVTGPSQLVYDAYKDWHIKSGAEGEPFSMVRFALALEKHGYRKVRKASGIHWLGIKAKSVMDLADEDE